MKARSNWVLKLPISPAVHLRAACAGFAPKNMVIVQGINELKSSFCAILSHYFRRY